MTDAPNVRTWISVIETATSGWTRAALYREYDRIIDDLTAIFQTLPPEQQQEAAAASERWFAGDTEPFVAWAKTVLPGAFEAPPLTSDPVPRSAQPVFFFGTGFDERIRAMILANRFPDEGLACYVESKRWAKRLRDLGIPARDIGLHNGFFEGEYHWWLTVKGAIFDPTASQFMYPPRPGEDGLYQAGFAAPETDEIIDEDAALDAGLDLFEMANLPKQDTGIDGTIFVSAAIASHAPRVKWYPARPGRKAPCLSVVIAEKPEARNHRLPQALADRMAPIVIEWVVMNRDALLRFWNEGETWTRQEVNAHLDALKKLPGK